MIGESIEIIDTPKVEVIEVLIDGATVIEVIEQGPVGPVGPQGPEGPAGPSPDLSSPPPIGDVTPNTGDFTVVSASDWVEATFITTPNQQAEITLNDTTGDVAINANSGQGTISLLAANTIGEDIQADKFSLNTSASATAGVGEMAWNDTDGTIDLGLKGGNSTLQLGQELVLRVKNDDSVQLTDGMVVYVSGANGTNLLVKRAEANAELTSASTIGVVTEPISVNGHGYITTFGVVRGINTNGFNAGDILYLSPSTAGLLTNVKPSAPDHIVMIGFVVKKSAGSGEVFVQVQNGYELSELHDVSISSVAAGQVLKRNAGNTLWENTLLAASDITSGTLDNARINWAAPSAIGGTTPAAGAFTSLSGTSLSLAAGSLSASAPFDLSQTWNNSGVTFTGLKLNVTDTASNASSLFMDLQVGGTSKIQFAKIGNILLPSNNTGGKIVSISNDGHFIQFRGNGQIFLNGPTGVVAREKLWIGDASGSEDLQISRDAANTLAQRNGTNAQEFRLYNTYTSSTNYERGFFKWDSNVLKIGTEKGSGGGTVRHLELAIDGNTLFRLHYPSANTYDCRFIEPPSGNTNVLFSSYGGNGFRFTFPRSVDAVMVMQNFSNNATAVRLAFCAATASYPALKNSTTTLQARLADDSAFTNIQGKLTTDTNAAAGTITPDKTLTLYDAAGTAYKVPCVAA